MGGRVVWRSDGWMIRGQNCLQEEEGSDLKIDL